MTSLYQAGWKVQAQVAHRPPRHGLKSARLSNRAEIDVNKYSPQHDQSAEVMQSVTHGNSQSAEDIGSDPKNNAGYELDNAANQVFPELHLLPGIEEARLGRFEFLRSCHCVLDVPHPACVGRSPAHWRQAIQNLQSKQRPIPTMVQRTAKWTTPKNWGKPAE